MPTLLIKNGRLLDPANERDELADVYLEDGKVKEVGPKLSAAADETIDATGMLVTPGLIDLHVHLREPGQEHKETIFTGTRAAAAGGFTTIVAMPNTTPVIDTQADVNLIHSVAQRDALINVRTTAAITVESAGEQITEFGDLVSAGAVGFTDDGRTLMNSEIMRRALEYTSMFNVPVMDHCEDVNLVGTGVMNEGPTSAVLGLPGIPAAAESVIVARDIELAEHTGGHCHIQHVSAAHSIELIRDGKARGVKVTAEATPHHLCLTEEALTEFDTNCKMAPPLRTEQDRATLRAALRDGTIDCIATDHAPHREMEKELPFVDAPNGVIGLETAFPACYTMLVEEGELTLKRLVELLTCNPARVLDFNKGTLTPGADADVTVIDLEGQRKVSREIFLSKSTNSAFLGQVLKGWPSCTVVGGKIVFAEGRIVEKA